MSSEADLETHPDAWKIRTCEAYKDEYSECKSIKARFHQYYIFGEYTDCSQWKIDADNCKKWKSKNSIEAFNALLESESNRMMKRYKQHYANDVWKKREKPPEDWNKPLPPWLEEKMSKSYLTYKLRSLEDSAVKKSSCCIL